MNLVYLSHYCFNLDSDYVKFHHEVDTLKGILYKNNYAHDLVDKCIKEFFDKTLAPKSIVIAVHKTN